VINLRLKYEGGGQFRVATRDDYDVATRELEQGEVLRSALTRPRSSDQNRMFHALCEEAFDNQTGGPRFETWRHLKSWLLIQAGWCETHRFAAGSLTPQIAAALRHQFDTVDFSVDKKTGEIVMRFARSISFKECPADDFTRIMQKAIDVICEVIMPGTSKEDLIGHMRGQHENA